MHVDKFIKSVKEGFGFCDVIFGWDSSDELYSFPNNKEKPVIVYCKSGGRSEKCAQILKDSGFVKVYDIKGGITEWKFEGKKTEK